MYVNIYLYKEKVTEAYKTAIQIPLKKISGLNISKTRVIYCCRFIRSLIGSRTSVKLKVSGAQLQSSCRRVNFNLTVLDLKRIIHRVFDRHCLDIKHKVISSESWFRRNVL